MEVSNVRKRSMLSIARGDVIKIFEIIIITLLLILMFQVTSNPLAHITGMWFLAAVAIVMSGFDFFHPYFWFSLFFTLYCTANAILWNAGVRAGNYSSEQILYSIIALSVVLLVVGPRKLNKEEITSCPSVIRHTTIEKAIEVLAVLTVIFSVILYLRGYSSKIQMRNEGVIFYRLGVQIVRFLTLFVLLYVGNMLAKKNKYSWRIIVICGFATLVFTLFTSERDVVFRYGFTIIMLLFAYDIVKPRHLFIIFPCAMASMIISVIIKVFFLRGVLNSGTGNIIYDFLSSDFTAAGRNFQYLLDRPSTSGQLGMKTFFTELFNPILFGVKKINPDHWFNYEVHTGGYKGYAFTLVGTGYAIAGLFGIILVFITVGLIVKYFYSRSIKNNYWMAAYIYLSSTVIFSFRQSLQTITGSLVKHIALGIVFCIIIDHTRLSVGKNH